MEVMNAYSLTRGDWESVQDICKFKGRGAALRGPVRGNPDRGEDGVHQAV